MERYHCRFASGVLWAIGLIAGCSRSSAPQGSPQSNDPTVPVETVPVEPRSVEYSVSAVGNLEAFEHVQVTSRVTGIVERVYFKEGDRVAPGALLLEIEPQRFSLAVTQARAGVARAQVLMEESQRELARAEKLLAQGVASSVELGNWQTKRAAAHAELASAQAALALAELNLRDSKVRAHAGGGIIQTKTVQIGQFVQPGVVLASLIKRDPLLLRFHVPEAEASRLRIGEAVRFRVQGESTVYAAKVRHIAAVSDSATRMVDVVGEVEKGENLRPGAFAEVTAAVRTEGQSLVVSQTAVRPSERGFLAYVVEDGVARERQLLLGLQTTGGLVEVRQGLKLGDVLVIRGAQALRDGAKVRVVDLEKKAPPAAASTARPMLVP